MHVPVYEVCHYSIKACSWQVDAADAWPLAFCSQPQVECHLTRPVQQGLLPSVSGHSITLYCKGSQHAVTKEGLWCVQNPCSLLLGPLMSTPCGASAGRCAGTSVQSDTSSLFPPWGNAHRGGRGPLHKPLLLWAAWRSPVGLQLAESCLLPGSVVA